MKIIYMAQTMSLFSQDTIQKMVLEGEIKKTEEDIPYLLIKEDVEVVETEDSITI